MAFSVNLNGLKEVEGKLNKLSLIMTDVSNEINASALKIYTDAKREVKVDNSTLRSSIAINPDSKGSLTYSVEARAKYAPYVEFGTGGMVDVPAGYEDFAIQFKGKGIRKVNLRARPFLIPAFEQEKPKLIKRLNDLINA
jgi:HK97 gp10 family phage protein